MITIDQFYSYGQLKNSFIHAIHLMRLHLLGVVRESKTCDFSTYVETIEQLDITYGHLEELNLYYLFQLGYELHRDALMFGNKGISPLFMTSYDDAMNEALIACQRIDRLHEQCPNALHQAPTSNSTQPLWIHYAVNMKRRLISTVGIDELSMM